MKTIISIDCAADSSAAYHEYLGQFAEYLLWKYEISIKEKAIVDAPEYFGSYDGRTIAVRRDVSAEHKLFLVAHLFGHCVQWCSKECTGRTGDDLPLQLLPAIQAADIFAYEYQAAEYAVSALGEALDDDLTQWFSDWSHADWIYFSNLQNEDTKPENPVINPIYGTPLIAPKAIPELLHLQFSPCYAY